MIAYFINHDVLSFILGLCIILSLGKSLRLLLIKMLYPNATLKDIGKYERKSKNKYSFFNFFKKNNEK